MNTTDAYALYLKRLVIKCHIRLLYRYLILRPFEDCPLCKIFKIDLIDNRYSGCRGCQQADKDGLIGCMDMLTFQGDITVFTRREALHLRAKFHLEAIKIFRKLDKNLFTPEGWEFNKALFDLDRKLYEQAYMKKLIKARIKAIRSFKKSVEELNNLLTKKSKQWKIY